MSDPSQMSLTPDIETMKKLHARNTAALDSMQRLITAHANEGQDVSKLQRMANSLREAHRMISQIITEAETPKAP
jgi:hypothetical protein